MSWTKPRLSLIAYIGWYYEKHTKSRFSPALQADVSILAISS